MAHLEGFPHIPKIGIDQSVRDDTPGTIKPLQLHCRCPVCITKPLRSAEEFSGLENEARFLESNKDLLQATSNIELSVCTWVPLLPKRLIAFILRDRKWAMLDIGSVRQIGPIDAFRWLVLPKSNRKMLEGLIKSHSQRAGFAVEQSNAIESDLVHGKGQGLILLLHGVPGKYNSNAVVACQIMFPLFRV